MAWGKTGVRAWLLGGEGCVNRHAWCAGWRGWGWRRGAAPQVKAFFEEHIHDAEEVRYILGGSGYFDVRDLSDQWVRIHIKVGPHPVKVGAHMRSASPRLTPAAAQAGSQPPPPLLIFSFKISNLAHHLRWTRRAT